ncbi:hypothetical protein UPYG_G00303200 [Umbra pygmaea]|uniref:C2H2-type domain-containing protein n=1 Tax=Umbra pygmaea TaxID=75934 RepID=A0ABD0WBE9_UMBPY
MSTATDPQQQPSTNTNQGQKINCTLYGCQRVYTDTDSLARHVKDHLNHMHTQSLPGKVFLCSSIGCSGSFPNMQQLMEHMRQHHKPNTYFLCESCRARLRSYRALLKHLHTCAKVAKSKAKAGQVPEIKHDPDAPVPMATDPSGPDQETLREPMDSEPPAAGPDLASVPARFQPPGDASPLSLHLSSTFLPGPLPLPEPPSDVGESGAQPPGLTGQPQLPDEAYGLLSQYLQAPLEAATPQLQHTQNRPPQMEPPHPQQRAARPSLPSPGPQTSSPASTNARWRKNQDGLRALGSRWNNPPYWFNTGGAQVSPSTAAFYGSTPGGATAAFSVGTPPQTGRR